jgi:YfiH family protein
LFAFREVRGPVEVAFTDRHGGPGAVPEGVLDLRDPPADATDPESYLAALDENIDVLGHALTRGGAAVGDNPFALPPGTPLPAVVPMQQVHGADVHTVDRAWLAGRRDAVVRRSPDALKLPSADALVTALPGVALLVRAADCVPVLLADVERRVVGAAHAGRRGLAAGIVPAAVTRMRELGAHDVVAWIGPHVCGRCYEVPAGMRGEVAAAVPESFTETSWGTPALDLGAGVAAQLSAAGVAVVDASRCTLESEDLWSHRRDGAAAGRLGGIVWVRP